ncbi:MAG: GDP-mannose 4,6-dehydratase [Pirellulaceae bacterium]|nr:GDP-mannose 4,6-dehydratase [Pirellulaceae bacterium]
MITNKKILITGGAGFIGSHLVEKLTRDNEVTVFDNNLENANRYLSSNVQKGVNWIQGDVCHYESFADVVKGQEVIYHLASVLGVQKVVNESRKTLETTLLGTRNLFEAIVSTGTQPERVVNISTSEVFGNASGNSDDKDASIGTENDPRLSYASSKLMGEHIAWAYHREYQIPVVNVRPFNIYGPRRVGEHAIGFFAIKAILNNDITVFGDGSQLRSWCYIDDFCQGMLAVGKESKAIGEDYNIGNSSTATTIYNLAQQMVRVGESSSSIITTDHPFSDIGVRAIGAQKAKNHLGYSPMVDLEEGLQKTFAWYREHLDDFRHWG